MGVGIWKVYVLFTSENIDIFRRPKLNTKIIFICTVFIQIVV